MSSEIDINNLRQLHVATTQGEWEPLANISVQCNFKPVCSFYLVHDGNRQFVIAAHNAMPALLDELERLRAENTELEGWKRSAIEAFVRWHKCHVAAGSPANQGQCMSEATEREILKLRAYRDDMHKLVEGVDVVCLRGENERLQQKVAELTKACEQYQEHSREMATACARLRGENELRQEAQVVAMEERDELRNALQELLDFSDVLQGRHFVMSNQVRAKAENLLRQHTETE